MLTHWPCQEILFCQVLRGFIVFKDSCMYVWREFYLERNPIHSERFNTFKVSSQFKLLFKQFAKFSMAAKDASDLNGKYNGVLIRWQHSHIQSHSCKQHATLVLTVVSGFSVMNILLHNRLGVKVSSQNIKRS